MDQLRLVSLRRAKRLLMVGTIATAPSAAIAIAGLSCSDDKNNTVGQISLDPGGTYGAEVQVTIVGRGRVVSTTPGIDCPSKCFVLHTFQNAGSPGAGSGIALKAIGTSQVRFRGWSYATDLVGARGRGAENCNPVKRAAVAGGGDPNAEQITLGYGETNGASPPGQEGACSGATTVPLAYRVTATFEDIPVPDAEPDANVGEVIFQPPVAGATAREIGIVGSQYLFWRFESAGSAGIAYGSRFSTGVTTPTTVVAPTTAIPIFEIDPQSVGSQTSHNVIYTTGAGTINIIPNNSFSPTTLTGGPTTCDAVASTSSTVWCLSAGTLYEWSYLSPSLPTIRFTGQTGIVAPRKFAADSTYLWFVKDPGTPNGAAIMRMQRSLADGGTTPPLQDWVLTQTNPNFLELPSSQYLSWINGDTASTGTLNSTSSSFAGSTVINSIPLTANLKLLALDSSSSLIWGATIPPGGTDCQIIRGSTTSIGTPPTVVLKGIKGLQGFTVDSSYIYWTQSDGRVYRRLKTGL